MKCRRLGLTLAVAIGLFAGAASGQTVFYVRGDGVGSDASNGLSWVSAFATLQKGLDQLHRYTNNIVLNMQASSGGQAYYVGNRSMPYGGTNYFITIQGGWTGVGGTPVQDSWSLIADNVGVIDQPGLTLQAGPNHDTPRTAVVCRVNFTNVTHGIYMTVPTSFSGCDQTLSISNCTITVENHGVLMDYLRTYRSADTYRGPSTLRMSTCAVVAGRSGSGDGIRINGTYPLLDLASDVSVSTFGGQNLYLHDSTLADSMTNAFRGTFGAAAGGYGLTKYGRSSAAYFAEASSFTNRTAIYGGVVQARAQNTGRPLGTGTTEINGPIALRLDGVVGVDAMFGPILVNKGQSDIIVNGASPGNAWTADALVRSNRSVLRIGGNGGVNNQYLITTNDRLKVVTAPVVSNGMVAPYFLQPSGDFLSYDSTFGFTGAVYTATSINSATATDIVSIAANQAMTANRSAHALWLKNLSSVNLTNDASGSYTLILGSGGLSVSYGGYYSDSLIATHLKFGTAGEKEALVCVGVDGYGGQVRLTGSLIATNGLTKSGYGTLRLLGDSSATFAGPVTVNEGAIALDVPNALPAGLSINLQAGVRRDKLGDASNTSVTPGQIELSGNNLSVSNLTLSDRSWIGNSSNTPSTLAVSGEVVYNGNEYAASIAPAAGKLMTLDLGNTRRTFTVADGYDAPDLSVGATIVGTGGLLKSGAGRLDLTASNNTFSGGIVVKEGMLTGWLTTNTYPVTPFGDVNNAIVLTNAAALHIYRSVLQNGATTALGRVTFAGGNVLTFTSVNNWYSTNTLAALNRATGTRGTLLFQGGPNNSARDFPGVLVNLQVNENPTVSNGMLPGWIVGRGYDNGGAQNSIHMTYDAAAGVKVCTYDVTDSFTVTATQKANIRNATAVNANKSLWALRVAANVTQSGGPWTLAIGSGSLLIDGTASIAPAVQFGATGTDEGVVYVNLGMTGTLSNSLVTTGGLTKFGDGMLSLAAASPSFSGPVWVQAGTVSLGNNNALGTGTDPIYLQSSARLDYFCNATLARPLIGIGSGGMITTGPNLLTVAATGSLTPGAGEVATLQVEDVDFRGTYNWEYGAAGSDLIRAVNLSCSGSPTLNITWLDAGAAALGTYEVFRYSGSDPSLAGWSVRAPKWCTGTLSLDSSAKRVLVTITRTPGGSLLLFR
jgi:autotransporter-associated beta strand protein